MPKEVFGIQEQNQELLGLMQLYILLKPYGTKI